MICKPCCAAADEDDPFSHKLCLGKTHCDCQHKPVGTVTQKNKAETNGNEKN